LRIVLAGSGTLASGIFEALLASHHEVVALIQRKESQPRGVVSFVKRFFRRHFSLWDTAKIAEEHDIPIILLDKEQEGDLDQLKARDPDIILVAGFNLILHERVLWLPRSGCINCHPSLLPRHRGPNPYCAAILSNEKESGITFHIMTKEIDAGPILAQFPFAIESRDTAGNLLERAAQTASEHVTDVLDGFATGDLPAIPQDETRATYEKRLSLDDRTVKWRRPAREIDRLVRACFSFTPARFFWRNRPIYLLKSEWYSRATTEVPGTIIKTEDAVEVVTGNGTLRIMQAVPSVALQKWFIVKQFSPKTGEILG